MCPPRTHQIADVPQVDTLNRPPRTPNVPCPSRRTPNRPPPTLCEAYLRVLRGVHAAPADERHEILQRHHEGRLRLRTHRRVAQHVRLQAHRLRGEG
eukprot:720789-Prorocentrum_minimum.AAC.1